MAKSNLQTLIIVWWIGAVLAGISLAIPSYEVYRIVGLTGWIIMLISTSLIIYMIKKIKKEDRSKELPQKE
jgi:ABC-type glycerol-3-phosphate transport system permease component